MPVPIEVTVSKLRHSEARDAARFLKGIIMGLDIYPMQERRIDAKLDILPILSGRWPSESVFIAARSGGRLVGLLTAYFRKGVCFVSWLVVSKKARKAGIASALLSELDREVTGRTHKIMADILTTNRASLATFRKAGYRQVALFKDYLYHEDIYFFEKGLPQRRRK